MTADELRAKIAGNHERLRGMESQIATLPMSQRKQYDALIKKAHNEITQLKIELEGMSSLCPACQAAIPHHFTICLICLREVPFKLWAAFKGAACMHHAGHTHEDTVTRAKAAVIAHLKQFGTALAA